jgi:hypothetical protein
MNKSEKLAQIGKFMGWIDSPYPNLPYKLYSPDLTEGKSFDQFKYNESWDELIPVLKKIQQLQIEDFTKKKPIMSALMDVDIDTLFEAVADFAKWYNELVDLKK